MIATDRRLLSISIGANLRRSWFRYRDWGNRKRGVWAADRAQDRIEELLTSQ